MYLWRFLMECLILYIKCFHFHSEAPRSNFLVIVYFFPSQNLQVFENVSSVKQFLHIFVFWWDRQTFYYYILNTILWYTHTEYKERKKYVNLYRRKTGRMKERDRGFRPAASLCLRKSYIKQYFECSIAFLILFTNIASVDNYIQIGSKQQQRPKIKLKRNLPYHSV